MKIYLAMPISGRRYDDVVGYIMNTSYVLKECGYDVLSPMTGKEYLRNEMEFKAHGYDNPVSTNHAIVERDRWMVDNSDVVFLNFNDTSRVSIGMVMELAWAHQLGKHTVVVIPTDNVHRHAFVLEAADIVFDNYPDAMTYLLKLANGSV